MMFVPAWVRDAIEGLRSDEDPIKNLTVVSELEAWLADMRIHLGEKARGQGYTLEEIGTAQERPRQSVHRTLKESQTAGLTHPDFAGVSSSTLRYWYDWWRAPERQADAEEEQGRDPEEQAGRILSELQARFDAGLLRRRPSGLKELRDAS